MENKLDLHGVRHHEVSRQVDKFIGDHLQRGSNEVEIIIGHSDKMQSLVDETLKDYDLYSKKHFLTNTILIVSLV